MITGFGERKPAKRPLAKLKLTPLQKCKALQEVYEQARINWYTAMMHLQSECMHENIVEASDTEYTHRMCLDCLMREYTHSSWHILNWKPKEGLVPVIAPPQVYKDWLFKNSHGFVYSGGMHTSVRPKETQAELVKAFYNNYNFMGGAL